MPNYRFKCVYCGTDTIVKSCKELVYCIECGNISKRVWEVPRTVQNFMPDIKGSDKVSKSKMKEVMNNNIYATEPPSPKFWHDVKDGKIVKKGNIYKRIKE